MKRFFFVLIICLLGLSSEAQHIINFTIPVCPTVGINSANVNESQVRIFPNPAQNVLFIEIENENLFEYIEIRDIFGKCVYNTKVDFFLERPFKVNVSDFPKGVYFLLLMGCERNYRDQFIVY
ncbi:MAG: T9SS type A sorting domain-containing protein [Bacteroidales bacterium]|nr:T9SS type A sorting domain-containing protein [Bacteroidales bacterium]